jgi:tRNA-2-methylthio-N6-dimethylallyladenosine synthase
MPRKIYLETFGCQMNVLDSELVLGQLRARGLERTESRQDADVVIFNTCSVREHAEQKVWSRLGELRAEKQQRPEMIVGVIGCMAERDGTDIFKRFPHVDILCGPGELDKLPGMVSNLVVTSEGTRVQGSGVGGQDISSLNPDPRPLSPPRQVALMGSTTRRSSTYETAKEDNLEMLDLSRAVSPGDDISQAYVRITRGCNKFCTYCVVPYTRGPEVHRPPQNILDEVRMLADNGAVEVTLLGQTINHYEFHHADGNKTTFADLLRMVHDGVPHLKRLRFVTSYPRDFTDEALAAMRDCPRICRYLHAPAQHGSDRILKAMNRGYTIAEYRDFVARARSFMPDVSLVSDFIVGFPTETDEDFEATNALVREMRFKNSFIFKYSPRPGTVAIKRFDNDIPEDVKRRRNNTLLQTQTEITHALYRETIGQTVELMVEGESKLGATKPKAYPANNVELGSGFARREKASPGVTQLVGRTQGDQIVVFDGPLSLRGQLVTVEVTDARALTLFGRLPEPAIA